MKPLSPPPLVTRRFLARWNFVPSAVPLLAAVATLLCAVGSARAQLDLSTVTLAPQHADAQPWGPEHHSALTAFHAWAEEFTAAKAKPTAGQRRAAVERGLTLARERRAAFAELMQRDPAEALAAVVPTAVRRQLPAEVATELEERIEGTGDFSVLGALAAPGGPEVEATQRTVRFGGKVYDAYVYGRRLHQTTKLGIPLHGVVLGGAVALDESALRVLDAAEVDAATAVTDLTAKAARAAATDAGGPVLARAGGKTYRFATAKQMRRAEARLEAAEAKSGPEPARAAREVLADADADAAVAGPGTDSAFSEGPKKLLVIRVDFSDLPGDPKYGYGGSNPPVYTQTYVQNLSDTQVSPFYLQSSYGDTTLTTTVSTVVYRMPQTAASYAASGANDQLHTDAENAAAANFTLANYDRLAVVFSTLGSYSGSKITYGGLAQVGGKKLWINGEYDFRVVAHELGHTYGLFHANLWKVTDGNPISASGTSSEYNDDFDTMGANFANDQRTDFNPWFKNTLGWIPTAKVTTVTASGTYRISRLDNSTGAGTALALRIVKDGTRNYWVACRRKFTNNASMQNGAYVFWGYNGNQQSNLLDMTTPGNSDADAALALNTTFTDAAAQISLRPVAEGGTAPNEYIDVQVTVGSPPPPNNDNFASAQTLTGVSGLVTGSNTTATREPGEPNHAGNAGGASVWYAWKAPRGGKVTFKTAGSTFDTLLAAYTGTSVGALTTRASNDDSGSSVQSQITFLASAGTTYRIAVDGHGGAKGAVTLAWSQQFSAKSDFNGDGFADMMWQNTNTGERIIWYQQNGTVVSQSYLATIGPEWQIAGTGDFNNDGFADLVWQNTNTGERIIWYLRNGSVINQSYLATIGPEWQIAAAGDFNGDGFADVVWQNANTGERIIWYLQNGSVSNQSYLATIPPEWQIAGAGDFNGDGYADFLWQNTVTGDRIIWYQQNGTVIGQSYLASIPPVWQIAGTSDFNGDGYADVVWQNTSTGERIIWYQQNGTVISQSYLATIGPEWQIADH